MNVTVTRSVSVVVTVTGGPQPAAPTGFEWSAGGYGAGGDPEPAAGGTLGALPPPAVTVMTVVRVEVDCTVTTPPVAAPLLTG